MFDGLKSLYNSLTGDLDAAYATDTHTSRPSNQFLDVSDAKEVCQLEDGVTWVRSDKQVKIYAHVDSAFKAFLDKLDAVRSARRIAAEGSAMWRLLDSRANQIQQRVMTRPYRDEFSLPTTAVDVLVLGTYMKRYNHMAEAAVHHTRGALHHTRGAAARDADAETPPDKGKEKEETKEDSVPSSEDLSIAAESLGRALRQETAKVPTQDNLVYMPVRFGTHAQVRDYILKQPKGSHVVAYPHDYETYLLYKVTQSTEVAFMSLLSRWIDSVRSEEFSTYEHRRTLVATGVFDPLRSLRTYLDEKVFFRRHEEEDVQQHRDPIPRHTVYDGVTVDLTVVKPTRKFACACSDTAGSSPHGENIFVGVAATIVREYGHRCATLYMIESTKDRLLNAFDEVLNEYRRTKGVVSVHEEDDVEVEELGSPAPFFSVSVATMDSLLDLRDKLEGLLPGAFKNIS